MFKLYAFLIDLLIIIHYCTCQNYDDGSPLPVSDLKLNLNRTDFIAFPQNHDFRQNFYHNHHQHHHIDHTDEYHNRNPTHSKKQPQSVPDYYQNETEEAIKIGELQFIPLDFMQKINDLDSVNDLLLNFVDDYEDLSIANRFGEEERNAAIKPKPANCIPELQTIKLSPEADPSVLYFPTCTRIERCGGCCSHSLLSCQPTEVEIVSMEVYKTLYTGANKLKYMGKEIKLVERHKQCRCDCKVQPKDCHKMQVYRRSECSCVCGNSDERDKCYENPEIKLWNPEACACQCREIRNCSTGYLFDTNHCKCLPAPIRRRYINPVQEGYNEESPIPGVLPLSDADYDDDISKK